VARLFIALEPDAAARALATDAARQLARALPAGSRFGVTPPERLHTTLAFLGEVPRDRIETLCASVGALARAQAPMQGEAGGVGAFPRARAARVLWLGFGSGPDSAALGAFVTRLQSRLVDEGHGIERRPWTGHVTLIRFRERDAVDATRALAACDARTVDCRIEELVVMESHLTSKGPTYSAIFRARFSGDARVASL